MEFGMSFMNCMLMAEETFSEGKVTAIPLAYGVFCATYDLCLGLYFYTRRSQWRAAWAPPEQ